MQYLFYLFAAISIVSALFVVSARSPINSVIALIVCFLSIAGHYVLLNAQFLAMVHVIVYTGAIMVLFLFVIMLLNLNSATEPRKKLMTRVAAVVAGGVFLLTLLAAVRHGIDITPKNAVFDGGVGLVRSVGMSLFNEFLLPFEVSSVLFLSAMVGALMLAKKDTPSNLPKPYTGNTMDAATPPTVDRSLEKDGRVTMEPVTSAIRVVPLEHYVFLSFILFSIGIAGVLFRRNTIIILMCLELMFNSVNLLLAAFSAHHSDPGGQVFVFFIMLVAAAEVTVGLAILVMMKRNVDSVDVNQLNRLKW